MVAVASSLVAVASLAAASSWVEAEPSSWVEAEPSSWAVVPSLVRAEPSSWVVGPSWAEGSSSWATTVGRKVHR